MHRYWRSLQAPEIGLPSKERTRPTLAGRKSIAASDALFAAASPIGAVLESFAAAMCVVAANRQVQLMNRAACELVAKRDSLVLHDGRLCGIQPSVTHRLDQALEAAFGSDSLQDAFRAEGPGADWTLQISVHALLPARQANTGTSPLALITAARSSGGGHDEAVLRSLFGLSPSEGATLKELLSGKSVEQCAQARGVAVSTVRSHLKSIFSKTNTTRQAQLMVVAQALPTRAATCGSRFGDLLALERPDDEADLRGASRQRAGTGPTDWQQDQDIRPATKKA